MLYNAIKPLSSFKTPYFIASTLQHRRTFQAFKIPSFVVRTLQYHPTFCSYWFHRSRSLHGLSLTKSLFLFLLVVWFSVCTLRFLFNPQSICLLCCLLRHFAVRTVTWSSAFWLPDERLAAIFPFQFISSSASAALLLFFLHHQLSAFYAFMKDSRSSAAAA